MSLDWGFSSAGSASMDEEDEVLASNEGSEEVPNVNTLHLDFAKSHNSAFRVYSVAAA